MCPYIWEVHISMLRGIPDSRRLILCEARWQQPESKSLCRAMDISKHVWLDWGRGPRTWKQPDCTNGNESTACWHAGRGCLSSPFAAGIPLCLLGLWCRVLVPSEMYVCVRVCGPHSSQDWQARGVSSSKFENRRLVNSRIVDMPLRKLMMEPLLVRATITLLRFICTKLFHCCWTALGHGLAHACFTSM